MGQTASEELVLAAAVDHADATAEAVDDGRDRKAEIVQARTQVHCFACVRGGENPLCALFLTHQQFTKTAPAAVAEGALLSVMTQTGIRRPCVHLPSISNTGPAFCKELQPQFVCLTLAQTQNKPSLPSGNRTLYSVQS